MLRWELLLVGLFLLPAVTCVDCGAEASERQLVDAGELCLVQHAIRWRNRPWSAQYCGEVAAALNESRDPRLLEAVCINESDLREDVLTFVRPGVYDAGLCGVRCVVGPGEGLEGRCRNGPARGHTLRQLLDGPANVRLADKILHDTHGGRLRHYNGGTREHGYGARVGAIRAAREGRDVLEKSRGRRQRETRIEKLTRQILEIVRRRI